MPNKSEDVTFMLLQSQSKKTAVFLTYLLIVAQTLSTMFLTRFYLDQLGAETYGLYQMIYAVAQYILILDLGISTVMVRYISEFDARGDKQKTENFAFHFALIVGALSVIIAAVGLIVNANLENIYRSLTEEEYTLAHSIFLVMVLQLVFTVISHYFRGICEAYERFNYTRTASLAQIVLKIALAFIFLKCGMGVMGIVTANTAVIIADVAAAFIYSKAVLRFRARYHYRDFALLKPAFLLMLAMLLQAVVGHVNGSVDKTILGIMTTKVDVAVYAIAATIVTMFNTLPSIVSGVFQPQTTRMVVKGADGLALTKYVARLGRLQFMIIGGFLAGFVLFGKDFIICWAGKPMLSAWEYVLVIMFPNAIPLMQNICLSILNAMDKRLFRSVILVGMCVVNIVLTILLIQVFGPFGAPLATGISYVLGHGVLMNIYYSRKIGLHIALMFRTILHRTWLCVLAAFALNLPLLWWNVEGNWAVLIVKGVVFCAVYGALLYLFGMNGDEKSMVASTVKKFIKHKAN